MRDVIYFFREGGSGMWVIFMLGLASVAVGVAYATGVRVLRPVAAGFLGLTLLAGFGFQMLARRHVEEAVMGIEGGADKLLIMAQGEKEAGRNLQLALGAIVVGVIPFGIGELKRRKSG